MNKTLIILGDSPFIKTVEKEIYYVLDRYDNVGINCTIKKYPLQYHAFVDPEMVGLTNKYPNPIPLSLLDYRDKISKKGFLYRTFNFNPNIDTEEDIIKDHRLAWCGFTHDFVLSFAIHRGYERVILIGVADFEGTEHCVSPKKFTYSSKLREASIRFIEEFCTKRVQIYTCNQNSCLRVPYLPVNELLT